MSTYSVAVIYTAQATAILSVGFLIESHRGVCLLTIDNSYTENILFNLLSISTSMHIRVDRLL